MYESPKHQTWPTPPAVCTACSAFTLLSCVVSCSLLVVGAFLKTRIFFSEHTVRSVHPSNPQQIEIEVTVTILSQVGREECLQLWRNLGLVNAWENITTSALNFLTWLGACQATKPIWSFRHRPRAAQPPCLLGPPCGNRPLLVSSTLHRMTGPSYTVKMQSLIAT